MRVLIVDDEAPARRKIRRFVDEETVWETVGEARSVATALDAIKAQEPDLLFLDVQLGDGTGFEVVDRMRMLPRPQIVFVTAFDEYAVRAFEIHAQDYLLKPVERSRFKACVDKISGQSGAEHDVRLDQVLRQLMPKSYSERLYVEEGERGKLLPVASIDRIEADRNYVDVHAGAKTYRLRRTLQSVAEELDPDEFVQVSRSVIIQLDAISEVQPWFRADRMLILRDGSEVRLSRAYFRRSATLQRLLPKMG